MTAQTNGRNRRRFRNLMIFPAGQVRLVFAVPLAGLLSMVAILHVVKGALLLRLNTFIENPHPPADTIPEMLSAVNGIFNLAIIFLLLSTVLVAAFGVMLTHRYYGPLVPILRALRAVRDGDYSARVKLRPGDELQDLAKVVNEISEKLGKNG